MRPTTPTSTLLSDQQVRQATDCACFNLRKAVRVVTQLYDDLLRPTGLRATQFTLLNALWIVQPVSVHKLAEEVVTNRTTLSRNLKPLERRGLILRATDSSNYRVRVLTLSDAGERALAAAWPRWREAQRIVRNSLGDERLGRMLNDLSTTVDALRE